MPLPSGITTATVTFGAAVSYLGTEARIAATLSADRSVVHAATGMSIHSASDGITAEPGLPITLQVPHVDQPGFIDSSGNAVTGWAYILQGTITFPAGQVVSFKRMFQALQGQTLIDLDVVPDGPTVPAVSAPTASVLSVAGRTGTVTAGDLMGVLGPDFSAMIEAGIAASPTLTVEQVAQTFPLGPSVVSTSEFPIAAGLYPQRLDQFALVTTGSVAASATDYWFIQLLRYRDGASVVIAEKTTKPTTGEAITAFKPWTFDAVAFSKYAVIAQGDTLTVRLVKVGAPAALTAPLATFRVPPTSEATQANPALLGLATFTGPDSATTVPAPEVGAWTILDGSVWGVSGNMLYCPVASGTGSDLIVMDAGRADVQVEMKVVSGFEVNHSCGLIVRVTDASNRYQIGAGNIFKVVGGAATSLGNWTPPVNGDTVRVVAVGATFKIYHQSGSVGPFVLMKELTDSSLPAATKHGIRNGGDAGRTNRFDDFRIEAAA